MSVGVGGVCQQGWEGCISRGEWGVSVVGGMGMPVGGERGVSAGVGGVCQQGWEGCVSRSGRGG